MWLEKYKYDVYRCNRCGVCTAKYSDKVRFVCPVGEHSSGFEHNFARGRLMIARGILEGIFTYSKALADVLTLCTTCGNCMQQCGAINLQTADKLINTVEITEAMRADIVDLGLAPQAYGVIASRIEKDHNPYAEAKEDRSKWAEGLDVPFSKAETIYFVGCTSCYRRMEIATDTVEILKKANIPFAILEDEWCCGSTLLRTGQRKPVKDLAEHNVEAFKDAGAKRVVTSCAGCVRTLRNEYPAIVGQLPFEVLHITEFLEALLKEGKMKLTEKVAKKVTYHDPCHIGRHMGIYDEPREVLKAIPGIELLEMYPTMENAWCCGGGGGMRISNPEMAVEIATDRLMHAKEVDAEAIVSACPFCKTNLNDAVKAAKSNLEIYDITELIRRSMGT